MPTSSDSFKKVNHFGKIVRGWMQGDLSRSSESDGGFVKVIIIAALSLVGGEWKNCRS